MEINLVAHHAFELFVTRFIIISGRNCPPNAPGPQRTFPHATANVEHGFRMKDKQLREREENLEQRQLYLQQLETQLMLKYAQDTDAILRQNIADIPYIYAITPTYARHVQKAELTRLAQTFLHVVNFHWIVVEDAPNKTELVTKFLKKSGLKYTHLNAGTPPSYKLQDSDPNWLKPRGVLQRNKALEWLRNNIHTSFGEGVVYFADDDNTYDLKLFDEVRTVTIHPPSTFNFYSLSLHLCITCINLYSIQFISTSFRNVKMHCPFNL